MRCALLVLVMMLSGCVYTDSALEYAEEGTFRVQSGYQAQTAIAGQAFAYMEKQNANCGVQVTMVNGSPVTTVKECVDFSDAVDLVKAIQIIQPQQIADVAKSFGQALSTAGNFLVPIASFHYGYLNNQENMKTARATNASDNYMMSNMMNGFTSNFTNTSVTDVSDTSVTSDISETINVSEVTDMSDVSNYSDIRVTSTQTIVP